MAYTAYATYVAYFSDPAEFAFARGMIPEDNSLAICPVDAAAIFGITWPPPGGPLGTKGFYFLYPHNWGQNILHPGPSGIILDPAILSFFVPGQTMPGFPRGDDMNLSWSLTVVRGANYTDADPADFAPIPPRRWAYGGEGFGQMEWHGTISAEYRARDASRVVDGFGIKQRGTGAGTILTSLLVNSEGADIPTKKSWERFYIRLRHLSAATGILWHARGSAANSSGARVIINPDGSLTGINTNNSGTTTVTFGSTPPLELDVWYKIDILVEFSDGVLSGSFRLFVNAILIISGIVAAGTNGLGDNQNHASTLALAISGANTWEIDFDDWHNAQIPNIGGIESLTSIDWVLGTHVKSSFITAGNHTNWTGNIAAMNQFLNTLGSAPNSLITTTPLAAIDALTDARDFATEESQEAAGFVIGPATVAVSISASTAGANSGELGYELAGGGTVTAPIILGGSNGEQTVTYLPSGSLVPYPIEPLGIAYVKGNDAGSTNVASITAFVQYIGLWGPEDGPDGVDPGLEFNRMMHNCRYPSLGWAIMGPAPDAPVCVAGGTYVGNSTFQSIGLSLPCHLLIIRNITTSVIPIIINTTMFGAVSMGNSAALCGDIVQLYTDEFGASFFRVTGTSNRCNLTGNTYQYFAFMDPGLRYMINGELNHGNSALSFVNPIVDGTFTPEFGLAFTGPATGGIWAKGPGHTALESSTLGGALITDGMGFFAGFLGSGDGISSLNLATAYTLARTLDGSGIVMIQIVSYVGDGTASRVINLTPVSTRFPLSVLIVRRGGGLSAFYRDASHTSSNSINVTSGSTTTTGITAGGVDTITVGVSANVNAAIYDVICFPGSGSGWLNGTFCGPNGRPPGDFWDPDPEPLPPGVAVLSEGGLILGDDNPMTLLLDVSGIYTLVPGKRNDTLYDRQTEQSSIDMEIPDPTFKTGYVGG